ncbi:MAG: DNA-binding protein [Erysipelotrichales bacterium]|nr:DNA-binding protein [Erysipelotrichales bacterium]
MDKIEEFTYNNRLLEKYGKLLTETQVRIAEQYYCYNLSLAEIAENENISRTAVSDCLKVSVRKLKEFEDKLNLLKFDDALIRQIDKAKEKLTIEELEKLERMIKDGI